MLSKKYSLTDVVKSQNYSLGFSDLVEYVF